MGVLARPPSLMGAPIPHLLGLWPTKTHTALFSRKLLFLPLRELHRGGDAVHSGGGPQTMTDTGILLPQRGLNSVVMFTLRSSFEGSG